MTEPITLVTGAASGIGRATALLAAERGHRLALIDTQASALKAVAAKARAAGAVTFSLECDISDEAQVARAVREVSSTLGAPTGLVANAGIEINRPAHTLALADWQRVHDVNVTGTFLTCKHVIATMLESGARGALVCTSSPSAFVGFAGGGNSAYGASKGAISALVRSLAIDYAPTGIRVNAVVPGSTDTELLYAGVPEQERQAARDRIRSAAQDQIPLGRLAEPAEVAQANLWLLSDQSSYVTGSHLVCDGGLMAKSANTF